MDPYAIHSSHERIGSLQVVTIIEPYEMMYGRPFLTYDLFFDEDTNTLLKHIIDLGRFQQELQWCGEQIFPRPQENLRKSPGKAGGPSISKGLARKKESKPAA